MPIRAKFRVSSITTYAGFTGKQIKLNAVYDDGIPENARFAKYTPSGQIEITIDNPPASDQFVNGQEFYVDFIPVE